MLCLGVACTGKIAAMPRPIEALIHPDALAHNLKCARDHAPDAKVWGVVKANGWIEGLTIGSIILGVLLGGQLVGHAVSRMLLQFDMPLVDTGVDTPPEAAIASLILLYVIAALFNLKIPRT